MFYYRRRVPLDVLDAFGREEVLVSLRTSDRKAASDAWLEQRARWDDEFDRLRQTACLSPADLATEPAEIDAEPSGRIRLYSRTERLRAIRRAGADNATLRPLDADTALELARLWFDKESDRVLFRLPPEDVDEAIADRSQDVSLFSHNASHPEALKRIQSAADLLLHEPGEDAYERLCEFLGRAMLELAKCDIDRLRREFDTGGHDHLFHNAPQSALQAPAAAFRPSAGFPLKMPEISSRRTRSTIAGT
ncbi:hypothetical protein MSR1_33500 [Magnetospirillum gryphiswaldense MSR-1]|nr:hypothetical protein MSR1_33500 [Magnetospirillum gryphiswaldense MSR-1]AVM79716.1 hypothetical protein MSR1L_33500 [Magnetospirillum gryphiswaldense]